MWKDIDLLVSLGRKKREGERERERMFLMSEIEESVYVFFTLRAFYV